MEDYISCCDCKHFDTDDLTEPCYTCMYHDENPSFEFKGIKIYEFQGTAFGIGSNGYGIIFDVDDHSEREEFLKNHVGKRIKITIEEI